MKELDELKERIDNADEIIDNLIKKTTELDKREIKYPELPDYIPRFEALEAAIGKLNTNYPLEKIQNALTETKAILEAVKKELPAKIKHQFDFKTKGWIIAGMLLLIITAIMTGLCGYLWAGNERYKANDIKFRIIRQVYPIQANWAEQYYLNNPGKAESETIRLEDEGLEGTRAVSPDKKETKKQTTLKKKKSIKLKKYLK